MNRFVVFAGWLIIVVGWIATVPIAAQDRAPTSPRTPPPGLSQTRPVGEFEVVAKLMDTMPTGVAVSSEGRVFTNFPRWGDDVRFTVAEVRNGAAVPYPALEMQKLPRDSSSMSSEDAAKTLLSVQSVVVGPDDTLWLLDTGRPEFKPPAFGGPKLVAVDLDTNEIVRTIVMPPDVALPTTYLNDVRFDLSRGRAGVAYVTDSSPDGPNAIIVVDLASGKCRRRLNDHPSMKAEQGFLPIVEGRPLMVRARRVAPTHFLVGADGIALSADGEWVYYCALSTRKLYRVRADALLSDDMLDTDVAAAVEDLGNRGFASDGLESDDQNRVYLTNYEDNAILRRAPSGALETVLCDPRLLWPDTLAVGNDRYLYFTANQLHRQARFQGGVDGREPPYLIGRVKIDAGPVRLLR